MDTPTIADYVARYVVEKGIMDQPAVERPYLPLHSLDAWSHTLGVLSVRLEDIDDGTAYFLRRAAQNIESAVMQYEMKWGKHKNGPAPTNIEEK